MAVASKYWIDALPPDFIDDGVTTEVAWVDAQPVDFFFGGAVYSDTGTVYLALTPSAVEGKELTDVGTVYLDLAPLPYGTPPIWPYSQPVLDDFNRADAASLGASWGTFVSGDLDWIIENNRAQSVGSWANNVWNEDYAVRSMFVWAEFADLATSSFSTFALWTATQFGTSTPDGYGLEYKPVAEEVYFVNLLNNAATDFGSHIPLTLAVGDCLGLEVNGLTITAYHKPFGGSWTSLYSVGLTETTPGSGVYHNVTRIGIGSFPTAAPFYELENFGGGEIPTAADPTDIFQGYDTGTVPLYLVPTATEEFAGVEAATIPLALTPGGTEVHTISSVDAETVPLSLVPSAVEEFAATDAATAELLFTPSAVENADYVDADTVRVEFTPSGVEAFDFVDSGVIELRFTPSSDDVWQAVDTGVGRVTLTPSAVESLLPLGEDASTVMLNLDPSAVEVSIFEDIATVPLKLEPFAVELYVPAVAYYDSGTVYLRFTPGTGAEVMILTDLMGIAYTGYLGVVVGSTYDGLARTHYFAPDAIRRYDGAIPFGRWRSNRRKHG